MEVERARHTGFCFGVRRAIARVLQAVEKTEGPLYTVGPIIHNPQMVESLRRRGVTPVEDVGQVKEGTVVFRTHGIMKGEEEHLRARGLGIIDATCPFVKKVRQRAMALDRQGYMVVIVGDERHPEVKSVLSYLHNGGMVLQKATPLSARKVGVVSQTTLDRETFFSVVKGLVEGAEELRAYNTICESTGMRQREAVALAASVDAMLVVGGRNSSNTTKLLKVVQAVQPNSHHIETADELEPDWFRGVRKVGITGGASTPDDIIDLVERRIKNF